MKRYYGVLAMALFFIHTAAAQDYTLDNKRYKTVSWNDFFDRLEQAPDLVYFDIRTAGERHDTSQNTALNQGRIRGARQIDFFQFDQYYSELLPYKQDTIYLYCSHSMRSRRLAKRLADSSFKKVVSIDGGISYLNLRGDAYFPLRSKYYETSLKYKLVSPSEFAGKVNDKDVQLLDIRPDSIYYQTGGDGQDKSYGTLKGALHIAADRIQDSLSLLDRYKEVILVDNHGDLSPAIANLLIEKGFKRVGVLFFGLEELRRMVPSAERKYLQEQYPFILPSELYTLKKQGKISLIDTRPASEFNNPNTGRLKDAVNIPLSALSPERLSCCKGNTLVIYDNMMLSPDLYRTAERLQQLGIKDFVLLSGGLSQVKWEMANTDKRYLEELVEGR